MADSEREVAAPLPSGAAGAGDPQLEEHQQLDGELEEEEGEGPPEPEEDSEAEDIESSVTDVSTPTDMSWEEIGADDIVEDEEEDGALGVLAGPHVAECAESEDASSVQSDASFFLVSPVEVNFVSEDGTVYTRLFSCPPSYGALWKAARAGVGLADGPVQLFMDDERLTNRNARRLMKEAVTSAATGGVGIVCIVLNVFCRGSSPPPTPPSTPRQQEVPATVDVLQPCKEHFCSEALGMVGVASSSTVECDSPAAVSAEAPSVTLKFRRAEAQPPRSGCGRTTVLWFTLCCLLGLALKSYEFWMVWQLMTREDAQPILPWERRFEEHHLHESMVASIQEQRPLVTSTEQELMATVREQESTVKALLATIKEQDAAISEFRDKLLSADSRAKNCQRYREAQLTQLNGCNDNNNDLSDQLRSCRWDLKHRIEAEEKERQNTQKAEVKAQEKAKHREKRKEKVSKPEDKASGEAKHREKRKEKVSKHEGKARKEAKHGEKRREKVSKHEDRGRAEAKHGEKRREKVSKHEDKGRAEAKHGEKRKEKVPKHEEKDRGRAEAKHGEKRKEKVPKHEGSARAAEARQWEKQREKVKAKAEKARKKLGEKARKAAEWVKKQTLADGFLGKGTSLRLSQNSVGQPVEGGMKSFWHEPWSSFFDGDMFHDASQL